MPRRYSDSTLLVYAGEKAFESLAETDRYILKTTLTLTESVEIFPADFELNATIHYISMEVFQEILVYAALR